MTQTETQSGEITLESLAARLDAIGGQLEWLCNNLASLFSFVGTVSNSGGGIRGMMKAMREAPPVVVGSNGEVLQQTLAEVSDE